MSSSYDIIYLRLSPQLGFAPKSKPIQEHFTDLGMRISQVPEAESLLFAGFYAGGHESPGQPLFTEIAFFHHPFGPGGEFRIGHLDKRAGVSEIHRPGPIGTSGDTEPASNTPVVVHHDNPVFFSLESGLGGAYPHAGRVRAMVAQNQDWPFGQSLFKIGVLLAREHIPERLVPDPLDLILGVTKIGNVVNPMAGVYAVLTSAGALPEVHDHGPPFAYPTCRIAQELRGWIFPEGLKRWLNSQPEEGEPGYFQEGPTLQNWASLGTTWQLQQFGFTPE
jgi:hypothetical protein